MRKIYQYILMAVPLVATASCSNELDEALQPAGNGNLQFVVSDFPAFGEGGQTRAIGLEDAGKSAWADGDKILVHLYSNEYGDQAVTLTFENGEWKSDGGTLSYLNDETPTITAVYAPDCVIKADKTIGLPDGKQYGEAEYILARTSISGNTLGISFDKGRTYSRLRFASMPGASLTVTITGFTPAGATAQVTEPYTPETDKYGNAYLYGSFVGEQTVTATAKHEIYPTDGITTTKSFYWFDENEPSTNGMSYVLGVKLGDYMDAKQALSGDVALKDGSFVSNNNIAQMTDAQKSAMAGIVFWTVVETDPTGRTYPASLTDDKVMNADFPHCTHGLIVSLTNTEAMAWQDEEESVWENFQSTSNEYSPDNSDYVSIYQLSTGDGNYYKILGYQNTRILEAYNDDCNAQNRTAYIVKPITQLSSYSDKKPAPFGSTGWYLPSIKELHMLCHKDVDDKSEIGTNCKTTLNYLLSELNMDTLTDQTYWSSTENNNNAACAVNFVTGANSYPRKMVPNYIIRYVCAF